MHQNMECAKKEDMLTLGAKGEQTDEMIAKISKVGRDGQASDTLY